MGRITKFMTVAALGVALTAAQAKSEAPSATLRLSGGSVAAGVGVDWGSGTLTYRGKHYPVAVKGLTVGDIGVTSMDAPHICVPPQFHSSRKVKAGDVVFCELSASWWDYSGQVLRSFTVEAEPTPLYRALHETAEAAFDAVTGVMRHGTTMREIIEAAGVIEERGFTIYDDLMHGFGGGYFPPILGSRSRPAGPLPEMTLEENMTVVVQPNVIAPTENAGVQVGELLRVTQTGFERLHRAPRGFFSV